MKRFVLLAAAIVGCALHAPAPPSVGGKATSWPPVRDPPEVIHYPATRTEPIAEPIHGTVVHDPYRWLENSEAPEVVAWSRAQDTLARSQLAKLPDSDSFLRRFDTLLESGGEARSEPVHAGSRYFFLQRPTEAARSRLVYTNEIRGEPRVLLDSMAWRADGSLSLGDWWVTRDGKWVAYQVKKENFDAAVIHVMNVETLEVLPDAILGAVLPNVVWLPDDSGFLYLQCSSTGVHDGSGPPRVRLHTLREPPERDTTIREASPSAEDPKPEVAQYEGVSDDGRWLLVKVIRPGPTLSADFYIQDRTAAHPAFRRIAGEVAVHSWMRGYAGHFYLIADEDGAKQRMMVIDPMHPQRSAWKEVPLAHEGSPIDDWALTGGRLAISYAVDAVQRAEVRDLDGTIIRSIHAPSLGITSTPSGRSDDDDVFYTFSSFIQPQTIMHASVSSGVSDEWFRRPVPFDSSRYEIEQEFFASKDGTRVPMFLVHKKGLVRDGSAPTLLTGYGGFAISQLSEFSLFNVPWLEAGGVLVSVNLRGGFEYGQDWHRAGMRREKQHVFDDFIAAAETLVRERVTSPGHLVATGFSNGGLLVAAATVQRPDLFAAVICDQPLTDMVRAARYGRGGIPELGDPDDPGDFGALFAYSPYHHVAPGVKYPPMLISMSEKDDRAHPMHARKFAAALQAATTGGPVLLRVQWGEGHMGADSRLEYGKRVAEEDAFAMRFAR